MVVIENANSIGLKLVRAYGTLCGEFVSRVSEEERESGSDFGEALDDLEVVIAQLIDMGLCPRREGDNDAAI